MNEAMNTREQVAYLVFRAVDVGDPSRQAALTVADDILALLGDVPYHVIDLRADGWTIKHPLSCRPDLFECPVNRSAGPHLPAPPPRLGRVPVLGPVSHHHHRRATSRTFVQPRAGVYSAGPQCHPVIPVTVARKETDHG